MQQGQGSIGLSPKPATSGAPFPAGSADNGLSVDPGTGRIVWGNDVGGSLATLLSNREIPMDIFTFEMLDSAGEAIFSLDPVNKNYAIGNTIGPETYIKIFGGSSAINMAADGNTIFDFQHDTTANIGLYQYGDLSGGFQSIRSILDAVTNSFQILRPGEVGLSIDFLNGAYQMGDISQISNGGYIEFNEPAESFLVQGNTTSQMLFLDKANDIYQMGDINNTGNGLRLLLDDSVNNNASIRDTSGKMLLLDRAFTNYFIGDLDGVLNGTRLEITDGNAKAEIRSTAGSMLIANQNGQEYRFGDIDSVGNGTQLFIDESGDIISLLAGNGIKTTPAPGGAGAWLLGKVIAGAIVVDAANYVETVIDGVTVKLLKAV